MFCPFMFCPFLCPLPPIDVVVISSSKYLKIFISKMKKMRKKNKNTYGPRDLNDVYISWVFQMPDSAAGGGNVATMVVIITVVVLSVLIN